MRLKYEKINGSNDILSIDLHNGFSVISITGFNIDDNCYNTSLYLKSNNVDEWSLIEKAEKIEFNANRNTINSAILKKISEYLDNGFFDYYINRYKYTLKCFDKGHEFFENTDFEVSTNDQ